ncbi:MAG: peptidoglycan-binding domain-containing protein [Hyphomicrobiales bacterium]
MNKNKDFLADLGAEPQRGERPTHQAATTEARAYDEGASLVQILVTRFTRFALSNQRELAVGISVCALVGAASINTLFLQEGKHPAPIFGASTQQQVAAAEPVPSQTSEIVLEQAGDQDIADPVVREIQAHLTARGYFDSEIDGLIGARTRASIGLYQRANNEPVTNEPSKQLLEHIRLSRPDEGYHVAARQKIADQNKASGIASSAPSIIKAKSEVISDPLMIKQIQEALARLGYNDVTADGVVGPITREAVLNFKKKHGLDADGTITTALLDELSKLTEL